MQPLNLLILMLAAFYVAYAVSSTHGPAGIFARLRDRLPLGGLTTCIICLAPWCSAVFYLLMLTVPYVVYVFAAAGGVVLAWRYTGGSHID